MSAPSSRTFQCYVDRLVISGGRIFGWGWAADPQRAVRRIELHAAGPDWDRNLPVGFGITRQDVEAEHPHLVDAACSGFVLTGFLGQEAPSSLELRFDLDDGSRETLDITRFADRLEEGKRRKMRLAWLARAVWRRLKRGDLSGIMRRARAQHYTARSIDEHGVVSTLLPQLKKCRDLCVMFDHNMGGGANQYRREAIAARLAAGQAVLLCTYMLPMLEYRLHFLVPGEAEQIFRVSHFYAIEPVLAQAPVRELFVNSPVSFDEPLALAEWLTRMREAHPHVRLVVTMHDYFAVCPSFVLLNAEGRFCGVPDNVAECNRCMKAHAASFVQLSPPSDIGSWRGLWGRCLQAADEVRCFSEATRRLLLKAYPHLDASRVTVVPHRIEFAPRRKPRTDPRAALVIGIVGEITFQKGARLVRDLVSLAEAHHPGVRVVVIGTLDAPHTSPILRVTGAYRRDDLPDLIEAHGINVVFFPSIWPETFSYVVSELTLLGVPIVAFDIGAPAERLRGYGRARLCREISAEDALRTLVDFHRELGMKEASAA